MIGVVLAFATGLLGRGVGLDRDRAYYVTVTIVVAAYYPLFAVLGSSPPAIVLESLVAAVFLVLAVLGFRTSMWVVAGALAAHGGFDLVHGGLIANPGVPAYWPAFCAAYDVVAAGILAWLLTSRRTSARPAAAGP